jgi:hypothetical protein
MRITKAKSSQSDRWIACCMSNSTRRSCAGWNGPRLATVTACLEPALGIGAEVRSFMASTNTSVRLGWSMLDLIADPITLPGPARLRRPVAIVSLRCRPFLAPSLKAERVP